MSNASVREMWGDRFGTPSPKIVCVGMNYATHALESGGGLPTDPAVTAALERGILPAPGR